MIADAARNVSVSRAELGRFWVVGLELVSIDVMSDGED